jgi:hypothetical protein
MKKLLCIVLALMLTLSLAACGGAGLGDNGSSNLGKYYFVSAEMGGVVLDRAAYSSILGIEEADLDMAMYIEITGEGTGIIFSAGNEQEMTYDATSMWPTASPGDKVGCTIANGTLTLEAADDTVMIFNKK